MVYWEVVGELLGSGGLLGGFLGVVGRVLGLLGGLLGALGALLASPGYLFGPGLGPKSKQGLPKPAQSRVVDPPRSVSGPSLGSKK